MRAGEGLGDCDSFNYRAVMPSFGKAKQRRQHILTELAKKSIWIFPSHPMEKTRTNFLANPILSTTTKEKTKTKTPKLWDSNWG